MKNKLNLVHLIKKYDLTTKSIDELQKIIGDSDRGCMSVVEANFLKGTGFVEKANKLYDYIHTNRLY